MNLFSYWIIPIYIHLFFICHMYLVYVNVNWNSHILIQENVFENVFCKMVSMWDLVGHHWLR